jgi:hypothetical protein
MYCPTWIYDIAVARTAVEFLSSDMSIEAFAKKYAEALSEDYNELPIEAFQKPAEGMLIFLSEIEAGDVAAELLTDFCYFRLYNESVGRPRKMKPLFGALEDGVKLAECNGEATIKAFRAYVYGTRSNTVPRAPAGWRLEDDEYVPKLSEVATKTMSVLDLI